MAKNDKTLLELMAKKTKEIMGTSEEVSSEQQELNIVKTTEPTKDIQFTDEVYAVTKDIGNERTKYLILKLKYDIVSRVAVIEDVKELDQAVIGAKFPHEQTNLKFFYDKALRMKEKK